MNNMHSNFSKDSQMLLGVNKLKARQMRRDIAVLHSTDMSYKLEPKVISKKCAALSPLELSSLTKFHSIQR